MPAALQPHPPARLAEFEQLMRRHNRMCFRTARAILRDDAEAEDALQEAYLRAYRPIGGFRGEAKLSTWLYASLPTKPWRASGTSCAVPRSCLSAAEAMRSTIS